MDAVLIFIYLSYRLFFIDAGGVFIMFVGGNHVAFPSYKADGLPGCHPSSLPLFLSSFPLHHPCFITASELEIDEYQ